MKKLCREWLLVLAGLLAALAIQPFSSVAQERIAVEGYEVVVTLRPHYLTLPSGRRGAGQDLVVEISQSGKRVAVITDNFLNGYGILHDYGPQPDFDTPGEVQTYWEEKDSIETYWKPIDGLILINNIPDNKLRQSLAAKWASLYQRIFSAVAPYMVLTQLTIDKEGKIAIKETHPKSNGSGTQALLPQRKQTHAADLMRGTR